MWATSPPKTVAVFVMVSPRKLVQIGLMKLAQEFPHWQNNARPLANSLTVYTERKKLRTPSVYFLSLW